MKCSFCHDLGVPAKTHRVVAVAEVQACDVHAAVNHPDELVHIPARGADRAYDLW